MKHRDFLMEFVLVFFVVTACITILEGVLGLLFLPDMRFGYDAFLSPPFFGLLSSLSGIITKSSKELSIGQMLFRMFLQLLFIEAMVFGINFLAGNRYEPRLNIALAAAIAIVFAVVYLVIWQNDRRSARLFNEKLRAFQEEMAK